MFEFLMRKTIFRKLNKEDQNIALILKDEMKLSAICFAVMFLVVVMPCILLLIISFLVEQTVVNTIYVCSTFFAYYFFIIWILIKFTDEIVTFLSLIKSKLFFSRYTVKGNALLKEDFEKIKKEDKNLYYDVTHQTCRGYCYNTCFSILSCLQKGEIKFVAIKAYDYDKETEHYYTMHVLYVNNGWAFDTYSNKQLKIEDIMKQLKGVEYKTFNYEDIEGLTYDEFREIHSPELKIWCEKNDCYEVWSEI